MAITKIGGGVETFTNVNTYSGNTTISNGVLQLIGIGTIANSANINIYGGTFDVSQVTYSIPAAKPSMSAAAPSSSAPPVAAGRSTSPTARWKSPR